MAIASKIITVLGSLIKAFKMYWNSHVNIHSVKYILFIFQRGS